MNNEMEQDIVTAAREFAKTLAQTDECKEYETASNAFGVDDEARTLLRRFQTEQQNAQRSAAWGGSPGVTNEATATLETEVTANEVLVKYLASQEELVSALGNINEYLTQRLGFDFANLARPAGGCCG